MAVNSELRGRDSLVSLPLDPVPKDNDAQLEPWAIRGQLDRILRSPAFCNCKRYSDFLRFIVERTLQDQGEYLKERTIGIEVFKREPDYDTNSDHAVRSAACEVRRRLGQYYQDVKDGSEIMIELRAGSYRPHFTAPGDALPAPFPAKEAPETPLPEVRLTRKTVPWGARLSVVGSCCLVGIVTFLLGIYWSGHLESRNDAFHRLWNPVLAGSRTVLLCIGENGTDAREAPGLGDLRAMTHKTINVEDAVTLSRLSGLLQTEHSRWQVLTEPATTFADLKEGPAILIGAFNNDWTLRFTTGLRFHFERDPAKPRTGLIRDTGNPSQVWAPTLSTPNGNVRSEYVVTKDYAIVSRLWNSETRQFMVVAAGITGYGTTAAGEFLANPVHLMGLEAQAARGWEKKNFEAVLSTDVIKGVQGPPTLVALYSW